MDCASPRTRASARPEGTQSLERHIGHADGGTICAVYPTPPRARRENSCGPGDEWHSSTEDNDVTVSFDVQVPQSPQPIVVLAKGDKLAAGYAASWLARAAYPKRDLGRRRRREGLKYVHWSFTVLANKA